MSLTRKKPMKRSGPIAKVSDKKRAIRAALAKLKAKRMEIAGGKCERCHCSATVFNRLEYAHLLGVGRAPAMELDPENAVIWCHICHQWLDGNPNEKEAYVKWKYPGLWERLEARHMEVKKG